MSEWIVPAVLAGLSVVGAGLWLRRSPANGTEPKSAKVIVGKAWKDPKFVMVARMDLKMGKGKLAAQCCHAAVGAYEDARKKNPAGLSSWKKVGQPKIVVKVDTEDELLDIADKAKKEGLIFYVVQDAGRTQIPSGSLTVVGVGPGPAALIDKVTGHLKLL